jgi:hypothetical protein|nr:hypothetical protein [Paraburkholderia xenovorans]
MKVRGYGRSGLRLLNCAENFLAAQSLPDSGNPIRHDAGAEFHAFGNADYFGITD